MSRRPATARRPAEHGFTLLEVMVALAILAVALLGLLQARSNAVTASVSAGDVRVATVLAEARLETLAAAIARGEEPPTTGTFDGRPDHRWRLRVVAEQASVPEGPGPEGPDPVTPGGGPAPPTPADPDAEPARKRAGAAAMDLRVWRLELEVTYPGPETARGTGEDRTLVLHTVVTAPPPEPEPEEPQDPQGPRERR